MIDRRDFLNGMLGCSLAASPLMTPVSFAATPGDTRLVVILLRGAMDGLAAVAPVGDPDYAGLGRSFEGMVRLGDFWALDPGLERLMPLWDAGQLSMVHAVSPPYRDKRSHFDAQDLLEAGVGEQGQDNIRDGWLNRLVSVLPEARQDTAYAVGNDPLAILGGRAPVMRWSPEANIALSPQALQLSELIMQDDPAMAQALSKAFEVAQSNGSPLMFEGDPQAMMGEMMANVAAPDTAVAGLARFAGQKLAQDARIASFSINGWDTHKRQGIYLTRSLNALSDAILTLRDTMGDRVWGKTVVAAVTEFGRTARMNGSAGTDHGTGGAMILAGGALNGGRVVTEWPGLAEVDLYDRRDLMPTRDLRDHLGWLIRGLFGVSARDVEQVVFPGLSMGSESGLLL